MLTEARAAGRSWGNVGFALDFQGQWYVSKASITQAEEPAGAKERLQKVHAGWGGAWRTQNMTKNRRGKGLVLYETWAYIAACLLHE